MKFKILIASALLVYLTLTGCKTARELEAPQYDKPLPPGAHALRKITDPSMIPNMTFACYELKDLRDGIQNSLSYMSKPSSKQYFPMADITHERTVASLKAMDQLLEQGLFGKELEAAIRGRFEVYQSVGCDDKGTVLFTGYYTPIFDGSMKHDSIDGEIVYCTVMNNLHFIGIRFDEEIHPRKQPLLYEHLTTMISNE